MRLESFKGRSRSECPNGIIFYDASEGITYEEANMLIMLLGEGSLVYWGGKPLLATGMSFFLLIPGTHSQTWEQKTLLDASRQKVHDLVCEDTHAEEDRRTIAGSARALRRRFEFAIPVAEHEDVQNNTDLPLDTEPSAEAYELEYDEYEIPVELAEDLFDEEAPRSDPEESEESEESEDQWTEQELPPENVFNLHEMGDALPVEDGQSWSMIPDFRMGIDITWPDYIDAMITSAVVGLTAHGIVNWATNRGVLSVFSPASLLTTATVSIINNFPSRKSSLVGEVRHVAETLDGITQFLNITVNGSSTDSQGPETSQESHAKSSNVDWQHLNDTLSNIRETINKINEHTCNMKTALDDCICESQANGWESSRGNDTFLDRSIKWLTGTRDNAITWVLGTLWDKFGIKAIRSALATGNGWQLLGAAMLLYKVAAWILNVFRNIRKVVMRIVAITQGICWLLRIVWNLMRGQRAQAQQLTQELTTQESAQQSPPPQPSQPSQQSPPPQPSQQSPPPPPSQQSPPPPPPPPSQQSPRRANQQNIVTEIHPDPLPEARRDTEQGGLIQSLMEGIQAMQEELMRRATELEDRLVNRQGRLEESIGASFTSLGQRLEAVEDRTRIQQVSCEQHHPELSPDDRKTTQRKHEQPKNQKKDATIPCTPVNHAPTRRNEKGPTMKDVHMLLPKRKENLSQFARRMSKLLELVHDPLKYATATERIFNIANTHIQSRLRGLPWGDAANWPRVQLIIDECLQQERNSRGHARASGQQNVRQEVGHTCENCGRKGHSKKDCPSIERAPGHQDSKKVPQTSPTQGQTSPRMARYNVMLAMEDIAGKISCLLDTGAETNVLPAKMARKHNLVLRSTKVHNVTSFNNQTTSTSGEVCMLCTLGNKGAKIPFVVCEGVQRPILGLQALQAFKLQLDCSEDCVYDDKGNKILIHNVTVSKN